MRNRISISLTLSYCIQYLNLKPNERKRTMTIPLPCSDVAVFRGRLRFSAFAIADWVFNQISTRNLGGLYLGSTSQCMLAFVLISWFDRLRARSNGRRGAGALDGACAGLRWSLNPDEHASLPWRGAGQRRCFASPYFAGTSFPAC